MGVGAEMKQEGHGSYLSEETRDWQSAQIPTSGEQGQLRKHENSVETRGGESFK